MLRFTLATLLLVCTASLAVADRPTPPAFCQDAAIDPFCAVLPGQGVPLPPPAPATDEFEVWVMQAPVWEFVPALGKLTETFKLIHTALGLVNIQTNNSYYFEFEGVFESPNATFPWLVDSSSEPSGTEILWCNAGAICWGEGIEWSYYTQTLEKIGTMNGTVFNKLIEWIPVENNTNSLWYETFGVYADWSDSYQSKEYLGSYTCDDFAWKAMGAMAYWGADFKSELNLKRDFINFYVGDNAPVPMNMSDPAQYEKVLGFYEEYYINAAAKKCVGLSKIDTDICYAEAFALLLEFFESTEKYVFINETYYELNQTFLGFDWHYDTMPVTPIDPSLPTPAQAAAIKKHLAIV